MPYNLKAKDLIFFLVIAMVVVGWLAIDVAIAEDNVGITLSGWLGIIVLNLAGALIVVLLEWGRREWDNL